LRAIQALHAAEARYFSQNDRYAGTLAELGKAGSRTISARGRKGGCRFRPDESPTGYVIHAEPVKYEVSGSRTFYSDENHADRENQGEEPPTLRAARFPGATVRERMAENLMHASGSSAVLK
jgi:hypothetical protein